MKLLRFFKRRKIFVIVWLIIFFVFKLKIVFVFGLNEVRILFGLMVMILLCDDVIILLVMVVGMVWCRFGVVIIVICLVFIEVECCKLSVNLL